MKKQKGHLIKSVDPGSIAEELELEPGDRLLTINGNEVEEIAKFGKQAGAAVMNLMPLIPCGEMKEKTSPSPEMIHQCRKQAGAYLTQFCHCRQCRADACGVPGEEQPHK